MNAELSLQDLALESIELLPDRDTLQLFTGPFGTGGSATAGASQSATINQAQTVTATGGGGGGFNFA